MEPIFSLGVVMALGGLLGVAICIIILLVAFLLAHKKDAMDKHAADHAALNARSAKS